METVGFVPEPGCGRGTVNIIWSCLATIFFVVWTAMHIDCRQKVSRAKWGISVFLMPEALPAAAIEQLFVARRLQRQLRSIGGWDSWALEQSFLVVKKGVKDKGSGGLLTPDKLVELAEQGQHKPCDGVNINMLPHKDDIGKRSKKSWLEKIIAGGQTLWFSANIISRLVGGYQVTLLEDVTMAYACCGLIAMVAWFKCPQDVDDPFEVDLHEIGALGGKSKGVSCVLELMVDRCQAGLVTLSLILVAGVHLAAWHYPFPSAAEAWIWRCCSLATLPLGSLIVHFSHRNALWVAGPVFMFARLALWTVACIAFRRMSLSAFDTPNWSNYWGHIGN